MRKKQLKPLHPFAYFSESEAIEHSVLFPYYILTTDRLLTISSDFSQLIIYADPCMYKLYSDDFLSLLDKTGSFIIESRDLYEIFGLDQFAVTHQFMNALPAIGLYFTKEMIESKINQQLPHYELFLDAVMASYAQFQKGKSTMTPIFRWIISGVLFWGNVFSSHRISATPLPGRKGSCFSEKPGMTLQMARLRPMRCRTSFTLIMVF